MAWLGDRRGIREICPATQFAAESLHPSLDFTSCCICVLLYFEAYTFFGDTQNERPLYFAFAYPLRLFNSYLAAHQSCVLAVVGLRVSCSSQSAKPQRLRTILSIWQRSPSLATRVITVSQQSPRETTHFFERLVRTVNLILRCNCQPSSCI
jgi:hypothetical protein